MKASRVAGYRAHAKTRAYLRRVDKALLVIEEALKGRTKPVIAYSGGKDSGVIAHLARRIDARIPLVHHAAPDPFGTREFCEWFADELQADLYLVESGLSAEERAAIVAGVEGDITERSLGASGPLGRALFQAIREFDEEHGTDLVFLGLRAEESRARRLNRMRKGVVYDVRDGPRRCCPIVDWKTPDVFAYHVAEGLGWHPVYDCERNHPEPERIRLGSAIPQGGSARHGMGVWLRTHWPAYWRDLCARRPEVGLYG